jgi:hypothetical protein
VSHLVTSDEETLHKVRGRKERRMRERQRRAAATQLLAAIRGRHSARPENGRSRAESTLDCGSRARIGSIAREPSEPREPIERGVLVFFVDVDLLTACLVSLRALPTQILPM